MRFVRLLLASAVLGAAVAVLCVALGAVGAGASGPGAPSCSVTVTGSPTLVSGAEQLGWEDDGTPGDPLSVSLVGGVTGGDVVCSGVPASDTSFEFAVPDVVDGGYWGVAAGSSSFSYGSSGPYTALVSSFDAGSAVGSGRSLVSGELGFAGVLWFPDVASFESGVGTPVLPSSASGMGVSLSGGFVDAATGADLSGGGGGSSAVVTSAFASESTSLVSYVVLGASLVVSLLLLCLGVFLLWRWGFRSVHGV